MNINVVIASDHNGVDDKDAVKQHLFDAGINCIDLGPYNNNVRQNNKTTEKKQ